MKRSYPATQAALDLYDRIETPRDAAPHRELVAEFTRFVDARSAAADRVRAAFVEDLRGDDTAENVDLLSIETIRRMIKGTLLGNLLGALP